MIIESQVYWKIYPLLLRDKLSVYISESKPVMLEGGGIGGCKIQATRYRDPTIDMDT